MAWVKTIMAQHRLELEGRITYVNKVPYFGDRPIIQRDSPIDGGVCVGQSAREAIVVDSQKYSQLPKLYQEAKKLASIDGVVRKELVLRAVFATVRQTLRYDAGGVEDIIHEYGVENDGKISLGVFLKLRTGVCRHQALACGALLEMFKKDGHVDGNASIDRNSVYNNGHMWCRYTSASGSKVILDVAMNFCGRMEKGLEKGIWCYARPDDNL